MIGHCIRDQRGIFEKIDELVDHVNELEKKLGNINRNMEYVSNKIHTAVQIEIDDAFQNCMSGMKEKLDDAQST